MQYHQRLLLVLTLILWTFPAFAYEGGSRLRATGGVHQVEGSAGGGIVPWAVIAGYGQRNEWSANTFATYISLDDYTFQAAGVSLGYSDRLELTFARHQLDISELGAAEDFLTQDSVGVKVRLFNNLIYDAWPQISAGIQYKKNTDFQIPQAVGAVEDSGTDVYLSTSKLWLSGLAGYPFLFNMTARYTKSNQLGLLGYGGNLNDEEQWMGETSIGLLLSRQIVIGAEYRQKPNNLGFAEEQDWRDFFIAWFPSKNLSITAAWADLGSIATLERQSGFYISIMGTL